eukprot:SAG22_NODE_14490_length_373_cov_0.941606_1_plen_60_part_01
MAINKLHAHTHARTHARMAGTAARHGTALHWHWHWHWHCTALHCTTHMEAISWTSIGSSN